MKSVIKYSGLSILVFIFVIILVTFADASSRFKPIPISYMDNRNGGKQVYQLYVSDTSHYTIDERFGLCFYETQTNYAISVVQVPCIPFNVLLGEIKNP